MSPTTTNKQNVRRAYVKDKMIGVVLPLPSETQGYLSAQFDVKIVCAVPELKQFLFNQALVKCPLNTIRLCVSS